MTEEQCYRLAHRGESVEVRGEAAKDALIAQGYDVVSEIDCLTGSITAQADPRGRPSPAGTAAFELARAGRSGNFDEGRAAFNSRWPVSGSLGREGEVGELIDT